MRAPAAFAILAGGLVVTGLAIGSTVSLPDGISDSAVIVGVGLLGPAIAYVLVYGGVLDRLGLAVER